MHLEEVEIINFCQHRRQHHRFSPGLTAIIGSNGSGKSNFLGAIRFALTGVNPNVGDKADNICQLAPPDERSYVRLVLNHGPHRIEVTRHLRPERSKTRLTGLTPKPIEGDASVNAKIAELIGRDFDTVSEMVLVPQEQIFGFLDQIPSKRAIAFQRLFRTEIAKDIYDAVNAFLIRTAPPALPSASVEECQQQLAQARETLTGWQQHISRLREMTTIQADRDRMVKVIGAYESRKNTAAVIANERTALSILQGRLLASQTLHQQYVDAKAAVTTDIAGSRDAFEAAKVALSNLANYRKIEQARQAIRDGREKDQTALGQLQEPAKPANYLDRPSRDAALHAAQQALAECKAGMGAAITVENAAKAVQEMEQRVAALTTPVCPADYLPREAAYKLVDDARREVNKASEFIRAFEDTGLAECPTCGTPTANLAEKLAATKALLPTLKATEVTAVSRFQASSDYDAAMSKYAEDRQYLDGQLPWWKLQLEKIQQLPRLEQAFAQAKAAVDASAFNDAALTGYNNRREQLQQAIANWNHQEANLQTIEQPATASEDELRGLINSQAAREKAAQDFDQMIQRESQEKSRLEGQIGQLQTTITSRESSLATLADVSEDQHELAQRNKTVFDTELQDRQTADTNLATAQQAVTYWEQALAQVQRSLAESQAIIAAREQLLKVRDLFHHSNLPRFVAHQNLNRLQAAINRFLEMFQTDFRVRADEGLSFIAEFLDHRRQAAERLSGGQKVILALAFRLAVNVMFAENIGLLALDEPTAFVDEHHIRGFEPVLQQLRAFSTSRGLQCVMITHERGLAPLFDAVISL
jgi:exonuclease SbcC